MALFIKPEDLQVETFALSESLLPQIGPALVASDEESHGLPKCCTGEASGCDT